MEKIEKLETKTVLLMERNKCVQKLAKLSIDMRILSRTSPTAVMGTTPLAKNGNTVISTKDVTAAEMLENMESDKKSMGLRLETIDQLMKEA